jgi:hypothetical protein
MSKENYCLKNLIQARILKNKSVEQQFIWIKLNAKLFEIKFLKKYCKENKNNS